MTIAVKKRIVESEKYALKCPNPMTPEYITIHNTANDASAANEISYMTGNPESTSYHFAVDDIEVIQGIPLNRNAWHSGDGTNGTGNRKSIAVEICYSKSGGARYWQQRRWLSSLWRNFSKSADGALTKSESIRTGTENTARIVFCLRGVGIK